MTPALAIEGLYAESLAFRTLFWAAVAVTGAALIQWMLGLGPQQNMVVSVQPPAARGAAYSSPFGNAAAPTATAVQPDAAPVELGPLSPQAREDLRGVIPPAPSKGLAPKERPDLSGVIRAPVPQNGLAPRERPELKSLPRISP